MDDRSELMGVTCDYDVHGESCIAWAGHLGRHRTSIERKPQSAESPANLLDSAWREAEAALPEGWLLVEVSMKGDLVVASHWWAEAVLPFEETMDTIPPITHTAYNDWETGTGPTPAAALRALAARLREREG